MGAYVGMGDAQARGTLRLVEEEQVRRFGGPLMFQEVRFE